MADMFEGIQELPNPIPGCPNFRRIPSYKVFCCGQPSVEGFDAVIDKVCGDAYPKDGKIIVTGFDNPILSDHLLPSSELVKVGDTLVSEILIETENTTDMDPVIKYLNDVVLPIELTFRKVAKLKFFDWDQNKCVL